MEGNMESKAPVSGTGVTKMKKFSEAETEFLVDFVGKHQKLLYGKHGTSVTEKKKAKLWDKAARRMRASVKGAHSDRTGQQLRKKWTDIKSLAHKYEGQKKKTGGGPAPPYNSLLELVLETLAVQSRHGVVDRHHGESDPFGSQSTSESSQEPDVRTSKAMSLSAAAAAPSKSSVAAATATSSSLPSSAAATSSSLSASSSSVPAAATVKKSNMRSSSSAASAIRHDQIQEEFLMVEKEKLKVMRDQLALQQAAFEVSRDSLQVHREILDVLKSWC